jgi:outer membrane protein insertion porin family
VLTPRGRRGPHRFPWPTILSLILALAAGGVAHWALAQEDSEPAPSVETLPDRISAILVEGNERIEAETIRSYLAISSGDTFDARAVNQALKSLYATGLFADVTIRREGYALIVRVVENPIINRVAFEGNRKIKDEQLAAEIQLQPRVVYTRPRVQGDVQRIVEIYRRSGRFAANVEPKVIPLEQNRVDLVFEIDEGPVTGVRRISFVGNTHFSDSELRGTIATRESAWYRFLTSDDTYDPDRLTFDRELLRKFYLHEGYADFRVVSAVAELTSDREDFIITFTVEEGEQYDFGAIAIESRLKDVNVQALQPLLTTTEGETYDADEVEASIQALTDAVGNFGYAFVDIAPSVKRDRERRRIDLTYQIAEGPRVYVDRIDIVGNVRTLDRVIRREFRLVEGDAFNAAKIRRSRDRIRSLGFFDKVEVEAQPGDSPDRSVLTVSVEEKSTGELSFGAGFSSADGPLADVSITERNLLGRGQDLRLSFTLSGRRQELDLSFTEPYFLDRNISAGVDAFRRSTDFQDESSFDEDSTGFGLRGGYSITEELSHVVNYRLSFDEISDIPDTASRFIKAQEGESTKSTIGHNLLYDERDNRIEPTEGYLVGVGQEFAGVGGTVRYLQHTARGAYYQPLGDDWVASISARAGYMFGLFNEDVRVNDRFFLGGNTLRGFEPSGVGPRDLTTDDALGGNAFYTTTIEVSAPIRLIQDVDIRGRVFTEIGSLFDVDDVGSEVADVSDPRAAAGVGFSYVSPFGPIRVDFSQAYLKEGFDKTELVRFSFGTRF